MDQLQSKCFSARYSENHSSDHYKTWQLCCPSHGYYLIRFWRHSVKTVILAKSPKNVGVSRSNTILDISQEWLVRLMWHEKEVHWLNTGYKMWHWPLTSLLDLGCLKVKFRNSSISGIVGLIDAKLKGSELTWYWADCMTLPFDHTHDLDLGVSRSESEIALSQEWGGQLTMNEKDVSHPFMTMILTCLTLMGWADVPDSYRGDFRRRRAVDISSYFPHKDNTLSSVNNQLKKEWIKDKHKLWEHPLCWQVIGEKDGINFHNGSSIT